MDQININTSIKIQVNSINLYPFRYQEPPKFHTLRKTVIDVELTKKERDNYLCNMMEDCIHENSGYHFPSRKRHKENIYLIKITNMDKYLKNSTKTPINPFQAIPKIQLLQLLVINLK